MNYVFISPNFPDCFYKFAIALKNRGITVLGIGDAPYSSLNKELKASLTEYLQVPDMSVYGDMKAAVRYFEKTYGPIDYIESNNEWWLMQDAKLRKEMNVRSGFFPEEMDHIKAKSEMKRCFQEAGVKTMRFTLVNGPEDLETAKEFASKVGYPVFVKPNVGVGASDSFKLKNEEALASFLSKKLAETYIMEEFINGEIVSFDGICDSNSNVVFCTSDHFDTPSSEMVQSAGDDCYYIAPFGLPMDDIDEPAFEEAGKRVIKAFGIRKRCFHIEFFVLKEDKPGFASKGEFVALECNMRPAGGNTPDLINYANSVSMYDIYADVIAYDENRQNMGGEKFYAIASSRRDKLKYVYNISTIKEEIRTSFCLDGRYPEGYADAMGDYFIYAKFKTLEEGLEFDKKVRAKSL